MSFVSLNTALSGIRAGRAGMDTAAHNVANVNTPGFTRQRVDLATSYPYLTPDGPMGTGVSIADIARSRDSFLDARLRADTARSGELDVRADLLARAETVLGEPENGLTGELTELWAAFEELTLRPEDRATRRQVLSALGSLAARVNSVAGGLAILERDTVGTLEQAVNEANGLFDRVADLNRSIVDATSGAGSPNDLLDERDRTVDELSRLIGAQTIVEGNGTLRVSVGGMEVVGGTRATHLSVGTTADGTHVVRHPAAASVRAGGEIGGMQIFLNEDPSLTDQLEGFVSDLVTALNRQHEDGYTATGERDVPLLSYDRPPDGQRTLAVLVSDPDDLAASGEPGRPHDGRNAAALADLRKTSLDGDLRSLVTQHAADVAAIRRAARGQQQLTAAASTARESVHGVSLDEEMVAMLNYQRALEASSRMMSAVDQALDTLINRTGLVGR